MTPQEARLELENNKEVALLDVRSKAEYKEGHIKGSILIPLEAIVDLVEDEIPNMDTRVIIYCRSGNRSKTAKGILEMLGYTDVHDLGGIIDWPYEIES